MNIGKAVHDEILNLYVRISDLTKRDKSTIMIGFLIPWFGNIVSQKNMKRIV